MEGETYSLLKIDDLLKEINKIALYKQYEFINASIVENINNNKINFKINITESEKYYIERVDIQGN